MFGHDFCFENAFPLKSAYQVQNYAWEGKLWYSRGQLGKMRHVLKLNRYWYKIMLTDAFIIAYLVQMTVKMLIIYSMQPRKYNNHIPNKRPRGIY